MIRDTIVQTRIANFLSDSRCLVADRKTRHSTVATQESRGKPVVHQDFETSKKARFNRDVEVPPRPCALQAAINEVTGRAGC